MQDQSGKQYKMDDYQVRYPTNVADVSRVMDDLVREPSFPLLYPRADIMRPAQDPASYSALLVAGQADDQMGNDAGDRKASWTEHRPHHTRQRQASGRHTSTPRLHLQHKVSARDWC